tara:strand:- start:418 stop:822 length:405 start_codon:yes stop_codon:yes gene_type:complete
VKLLIDNNLPPKLAESIDPLFRDDGCEIVHLRDKFPESAVDVVWIEGLAQEGNWAFLSYDRKILTKPHEVKAFKDSKLIGFFLAKAWQKQDLPDLASRLILRIPVMKTQFRIAHPGSAYRINIKSKRLEPISFK